MKGKEEGCGSPFFLLLLFLSPPPWRPLRRSPSPIPGRCSFTRGSSTRNTGEDVLGELPPSRRKEPNANGSHAVRRQNSFSAEPASTLALLGDPFVNRCTIVPPLRSCAHCCSRAPACCAHCLCLLSLVSRPWSHTTHTALGALRRLKSPPCLLLSACPAPQIDGHCRRAQRESAGTGEGSRLAPTSTPPPTPPCCP